MATARGGGRKRAGAALAAALAGSRWLQPARGGGTTETGGQSAPPPPRQHGGAQRGRERGGGGGSPGAPSPQPAVPPPRRSDAGRALPALLRLPGRPGAPLPGLRRRLVPALARRLRLGRQRPHVQLAPGADGGGHGGAVRRSGPGVPPARRLARPQAPLEGPARHPGPDGLRPHRGGAGGRLRLPQRLQDAQHVLAAQLAGAGHRAALFLPVAGWLQRLPAALLAPLAPCPLQARPRLLWLHHSHALCGILRVGHQREALLQPEKRDSNDAVQPPAPRGRLRQRAGAPHRPLRGAGAVRPGQAGLEAPRGRLHGHAPAPARHRALTPPRSVPAVPGLPARSSPTPLLSRLPRRLAFAGLPVPNALLLVGRTGSAALQQRCRCGGDVSLPPLWPSTGLLPASGQEQLQRRAPACILVPLPASSCGVQLSPRAWTMICAKSAAPEPCGAISGTSSGWKPPEEHPVTGGAGTQHSVGCPSPVSSTGTAGALAPCLTLRGDVCVVVGPAQQPSGTPNKMLASAALLHLCPLGQPRPVLMFSLFWVCCVVPPAPRCRASSAPALKFLFCPPPGASSRPRECSHVSLMASPPSHGAEMRARG